MHGRGLEGWLVGWAARVRAGARGRNCPRAQGGAGSSAARRAKQARARCGGQSTARTHAAARRHVEAQQLARVVGDHDQAQVVREQVHAVVAGHCGGGWRDKGGGGGAYGSGRGGERTAGRRRRERRLRSSAGRRRRQMQVRGAEVEGCRFKQDSRLKQEGLRVDSCQHRMGPPPQRGAARLPKDNAVIWITGRGVCGAGGERCRHVQGAGRGQADQQRVLTSSSSSSRLC